MQTINFSPNHDEALIQGFNIISEHIESAYAGEWPFDSPVGSAAYPFLYQIIGHMEIWAANLSHRAIDEDSQARVQLLATLTAIRKTFKELEENIPQDDYRTMDEVGRDLALKMLSGESRVEEMKPFIQMTRDIVEVINVFDWEDNIETSDVLLLLDED
ncbi:MAG: hypothetical protein ABJH04_07615 [Cyclobacteriaceae bacterium]